MHEMGITQSIISTAVEAAEEQGATKISEVRISVGELTEIVDFALQFAWEALTPGTIAEGSTLTINKIGAKSRCGTCGEEFEHGRFDIVCPKCSSFMCEQLQGRELRIDSIEADT